jgi:heterodisulfide reductase subunit C/nitrate reductase gamma subunit
MFFTICLYAGLVIFGLGLVYKISGWFRHSLGITDKDTSPHTRFAAAVKGIAGTVASPRILALLKVLVLEVVLQTRILREDSYRWIMHILIFGGFTLLLLMHALGDVITIRLFPEYYPSINPFLFLRDLSGILVLVGLILAVYRRIALKGRYIKTRFIDRYAIAIVAIILFSGFLLEGTKIVSPAEYLRMVEDYAATDDAGELAALESFWVQDYGLASRTLSPPFDRKILTMGEEVHEENCAGCHSPQKWAFTGYTLAKLTHPFALAMDSMKVSGILWYIHIIASFLGLAYLPFSKMFHIIASPVSLLVNAVMDPKYAHPANVVTRQVMELDACTHCGTCSMRCSTAIASETLNNLHILPSERMLALKVLARSGKLSESETRAIQEGIYLCTNCDRCTVVCPVGINLRELWFNVREHLIQRGHAEPLVLTPYSFYRGLKKGETDGEAYARPVDLARKTLCGGYEDLEEKDRILPLTGARTPFKEDIGRSDGTFSYCFACENCTTVCPVVGNYENPREVLDLLPHQIMRSVGLGIEDLALGSRMLWDCVTCYQCQEHCPQGVHVTDLIYELKNRAVTRTQPDSKTVPVKKAEAA